MDKIIAYLSHLDGVKVGKVNASGSHYFDAPGVKIRVSDHIASSFNPSSTLNIMVDVLTDSFCVFYGNRIVPIQNYTKLREFLRNFVMVCDVLAPLTSVRQQTKVVEKIVKVKEVVSNPVGTQPSYDSSEWVWVGDLPQNLRDGIVRNVNNVRKMSAHKLK